MPTCLVCVRCFPQGCGALSDMFGRKRVLALALLVNAMGSCMSATAHDFWAFLLWRILSGIGVGGSIPVVFAYFSEFVPVHNRGKMITALASFWMIGMVGGRALSS